MLSSTRTDKSPQATRLIGSVNNEHSYHTGLQFVHNTTSIIMRSSISAALMALVAGVTAVGSARPDIVASPYQPRVPIPTPAERTKLCTVKTHGNGSDDSAYILSAFHKCNNGGKILFPKNTTYTIGTAMDWTFLRHVDIGELYKILHPIPVLSRCPSCKMGTQSEYLAQCNGTILHVRVDAYLLS